MAGLEKADGFDPNGEEQSLLPVFLLPLLRSSLTCSSPVTGADKKIPLFPPFAKGDGRGICLSLSPKSVCRNYL